MPAAASPGPSDDGDGSGIRFPHPIAFCAGILLVVGGVLGHLPMYLMGRDNGFRLTGMPMDAPMLLGMVAIVVGLAASLYGLLPPSRRSGPEGRLRIEAMDDARLGWAHIALLIAMSVAVTIDIMKPTALAFVMPGMTLEYGLRSPINPTGMIAAAWVPLSGIVGTVLGSFLWGWLGDRIGRRACILYAGIGFIATSVCGAMPDFWWNVAMCFLMGLAVGGMLPICYALLAETMPSRHRGWLMILVGADIAGAYILTSWLASALVPDYSWRILWLVGLPTGVVFIFLNRWIPESPRFLMLKGRFEEARSVMKRYGAELIVEADAPRATETAEAPARWMELFKGQHTGASLAICFLALGSGLVLFGFNLWIPTNLRKLGITDADEILRNASLMGFPLTFVVAWMYGFWSSKKTITILSAVTAAALFGFVVEGDNLLANRGLLYLLLVVPIWGIGAVIAVLSVYSSEIYPTRVRSHGTGFAAAASKAGGVAIIALVVFGITTPSIRTVALIGAVPLTLAAIFIAFFGIETRKRTLEAISADVRIVGT
jgi:putative MFS transporter